MAWLTKPDRAAHAVDLDAAVFASTNPRPLFAPNYATLLVLRLFELASARSIRRSGGDRGPDRPEKKSGQHHRLHFLGWSLAAAVGLAADHLHRQPLRFRAAYAATPA